MSAYIQFARKCMLYFSKKIVEEIGNSFWACSKKYATVLNFWFARKTMLRFFNTYKGKEFIYFLFVKISKYLYLFN